jgi:hypothetical protein
MIIVTIISSIQLGVDNPLRDPSSTYSKMILIIDYVLTAIFALEALIKIIANGLVNSGVRSYFRDITNIMDLFLVLVTVSIHPFLREKWQVYYINRLKHSLSKIIINYIGNIIFSTEQSEFNKSFKTFQAFTPSTCPSSK